jgi:nucleotide-binding universal stress UspA family protein
MKFPIFHAFIAPDSGAAKPLKAMNTAFSLANALDAQLSVAIGALQISVRTILSSSMVEGLISDENKRSADSATAARERITELARKSGLVVHTEILKDDLANIKRRCASRARIHGLVFAEAGIPGELLGGALIEPLIFEGGRPVIVVPNGFTAGISLDHILVAWDGSAGASRAVWDSLPLLRLAKTIEIVTVTGEKELDDVPAANALAGMLTYLGRKVAVTALALGRGTAAGLIKEHAAKCGAGLVVQGAYGRSRWSELILGGVTREMLHDCTIPVLMSH